jgi:hypothetical protein
MKLGLYSITYLGVWYRGRALTIEELIDRAREYGYEGVEIDGKRPHGNPLDLPRRRCQELQLKARDAGIEIYAVAANNDFSSPVPEYRESQLLYVRDLIRMTADLGVKTLRMFAAWPGVTITPEDGARYTKARQIWREAHSDTPPEQTWEWCREGLAEAARMAGDACLDAPLAARQGVTSMQEAAREVAGLQVLSHYGGEYQQSADGSVLGLVRNPDETLTPEDYYLDFALGMQEIGYDGYLGYELCHPLPKVNGETVGIEFADLNARLAAQYMRGILKQAERTPVTKGA